MYATLKSFSKIKKKVYIKRDVAKCFNEKVSHSIHILNSV